MGQQAIYLALVLVDKCGNCGLSEFELVGTFSKCLRDARKNLLLESLLIIGSRPL